MLHLDILAQVNVESIDVTVHRLHASLLTDHVEYFAIDQIAWQTFWAVVIVECDLHFDGLGHIALLVDSATLSAGNPFDFLAVEVVEHAKKAYAVECIVAVGEVLVVACSYVLAALIGATESAPCVGLVLVLTSEDGTIRATQQVLYGNVSFGWRFLEAVEAHKWH